MDEGKCPGFSKYLYFLFAPTLVYKDNYPRYSLYTTLVDSDKSSRAFSLQNSDDSLALRHVFVSCAGRR